MKTILFRISSFVFLICFLFLISKFGFIKLASASTGLSISPPVTEVLIAPNKSLRTTLNLTNDGEDTSVILSLHSLIPTDDLGHSTINPRPLDQTSIPLVIKTIGTELDQPIQLIAGQSFPITLELEAANLDEPQDVYFALLARPIDPNSSPTMTASTPGITALFLATVTPTSSLPTNIALTPPELPVIQDTTLPLTIDIKAENKTSIMLQVQGKVKLLSPNKSLITESNIDPKLILGNTSRLLSDFEFQISDFAIGPHTLTIELTTIGGRTLTEHSYVIWMLPLRYLLVLVIILILISIPLLRKIRLTSSIKKA